MAPTRLRRFAVGLLLGLALSCPAAQAASPAPIRLGAHISAEGILGAPAEAGVLEEFSTLIGRSPEIVMDYSSPTEPLLTPVEIANLEARDETPMITWQLFQTGWNGPGMSLQGIAEGQYDSYFRAAAKLARGLGFEIMIRPGHEMNGDWYPWSGNPAAYVAAWRHMVSVFREEGAENVKWVWAPNVEYDSYPFAAYFPGDESVDYVALDGYNWGHSGQGTDRWESLYEVFAASYKRITELSSKPVILSEVASGEAGGNKAEWIRNGFLKTIPNSFPRVAAIVWFDYDKEEDWRVNSSPEALQAFREVAASPLYGGAAGATAAPTAPAPAPAPVEVVELAVESSSRTQAADSSAPPPALVSFRLSHKAKVRIVVHKAKGKRGQGKRALAVHSGRGGRRRSRVSLARLTHLSPARYVLTVTAGHGSTVTRRSTNFRIGHSGSLVHG
ncbi:MAG TPA: glycosyl hydrolase [Solirubrobacterales bacterium]|jgi:hypothetical protein|nr:glycosyl hydrolase [Solirubrobacterales bacterium]